MEVWGKGIDVCEIGNADSVRRKYFRPSFSRKERTAFVNQPNQLRCPIRCSGTWMENKYVGDWTGTSTCFELKQIVDEASDLFTTGEYGLITNNCNSFTSYMMVRGLHPEYRKQ